MVIEKIILISDSIELLLTVDKTEVCTYKMMNECKGDWEGLIKGRIRSPYTFLQCRTVRIGSLKMVPAGPVILSTNGILIPVPCKGNKSITLLIYIKEIVKVLIYFGQDMPVLFFYTTPKAATRICSLLNVGSKSKPYYDPESTCHTQKLITLLPERILECSKEVLKIIFGNLHILDELNSMEANDILVRSSLTKKKIRRLKRRIGISPAQEMSAKQMKKRRNNVQKIMVYPPPPAKDGISINTSDFACLEKDKFLNDVIILFYLKYLTLSVLSEHDKARTHVLDSYFYNKLTTEPQRSTSLTDSRQLSTAEIRHSRVKSWTNKVNLFQKDFVVIPINEYCHWFVAIICFPGLMGCARMLEPEKNTEVPSSETDILVKPMSTLFCTNIVPDTIYLDSDEEDLEENDELMKDGSFENNGHSVKCKLCLNPHHKAHQKSYKQPDPIKQPCILIFDSFACTIGDDVASILRDYLSIEYKVKEGKERDFSENTFKGYAPEVPQQKNLTDCGLYLLQYVESFFLDPIKDFRLPIQNLTNWFSEDAIDRKRKELHSLMLKLMEQNNVDIGSLNLPELTFSDDQNNCGSDEDSN